MKKSYNNPHFLFMSEFSIMFIASFFAHMPKMNSIITSFNRNNRNIIKTHSSFSLNHGSHYKGMTHF